MFRTFAMHRNHKNRKIMNKENSLPQKNRTLLFIILTAALAIALIILFILFNRTKNNLEELVQEKELQRIDLQSDLNSLLIEHEQIKADYGSIADSLLTKDSLIQANAKEIKRLLNTQWEYVKVKRKLKALQEISQVYVVQLDSLYTVNKELQEENKVITEKYQTERRKNTELIRKKDELTKKVTEASIFKAYSIDFKAINIRGSKEKETDKARRTNRLDVCFTLGENLVIEPGIHTIYLRIAAPDLHILTRGEGDDYSFDYQGEKLQYSVKQDVDYNNKSMDVCMSWLQLPEDGDIEKGQYIVNIFSGDQEIGQKTVVLN